MAVVFVAQAQTTKNVFVLNVFAIQSCVLNVPSYIGKSPMLKKNLHMQATGWEVLCVVMLEALSKNRLTELRSNIESRDIDEYLTKFCEQRDLDMCHLSELTAMFLPE